jgi:hypothetical protein
MAIIRERRQYLSQPIGVVRAEVADIQGARSIGQLADTLIEGSYKALLEDAEKEGTELAQSASLKDVRTIDPETGMPTAYKPPSQFGRVASKAYQSVVERRYVTETERELKNYSAKIYAENILKPNGFEAYSTLMRAEAENVAKGALPRFANVVEGIASSLVASTETEFIKRRAEFDLEKQSIKSQEDADNDAATLSGMFATIDLGNQDRLEELEGAVTGFFQAQRNALNATVFGADTYSQQENKLVLGVSDGIKKQINQVYLNSQQDPNNVPLKPEDIKLLELVIATGGKDISQVDDRLKPFAKMAQGLNIQLVDGEDANGKEIIVDRDLTPILNAALAKDVSALFSDANSIQTSFDATASEEDKNTRLSFELGLFRSGPDGGINNSIKKIEDALSNNSLTYVSTLLTTEINDIEIQGRQFNVARDTIIKAQQALRKGALKVLTNRLYQNIIPQEGRDGQAVMRSLSPTESANVEAYFDGQRGGITLQDLPESVRPLVQAIEKNKDSFTEDYFNRYLTGKDTALQQEANAQTEGLKTIKLGFEGFSGTGENNEKTRKAMDTVSNVPDVPNYFLSQEGFETAFPTLSQEYVKAGFVGENLKDTAEYIADGGVGASEGDVNRFFMMYDSIRNKSATLGHTVSPWDRSLSSQQVAVLDTVNEVTKNLGGSANAFSVYRQLMEAMSPANKASFEDRMQSVTGSKDGMSFVRDAVGVNNIAARKYFEPLVKYYVAGGMGAEKIIKTIQNTMDRHFVDTEGYVIDPTGGTDLDKPFKSQFGLAKFINSKSDRISAIRNLNRYLREVGVNAHVPRQETTLREKIGVGLTSAISGTTQRDLDILDKESAGVARDSKEVFLYPVRGQGTGQGDDVIYQLVTIENGMMEMFTSEVNGVDRPFYFSLQSLKGSLNPLPPEISFVELMEQNDFNMALDEERLPQTGTIGMFN